MKTPLKSLLLATVFISLSANALTLPEIAEGRLLDYKGPVRCGSDKIGSQKRFLSISELRADGSFDIFLIDRGHSNFGIWRTKQTATINLEGRKVFETLHEGTNCFNRNGSFVDITVGEETVKTCVITNDLESQVAKFYFVAGYALPIRVDSSAKPPTQCEGYNESLTIIL